MTETLHELKAKGGVRIRLLVTRPINAVLGYESSRREDQPNKPTTNMTMTSPATLTEPGDHGSWGSCADHSATPSNMAHRIRPLCSCSLLLSFPSWVAAGCFRHPPRLFGHLTRWSSFLAALSLTFLHGVH